MGLAACPDPLPSRCRLGMLPWCAQPTVPHLWVLEDRAPMGFAHLLPRVGTVGHPLAVMPGGVAATRPVPEGLQLLWGQQDLAWAPLTPNPLSGVWGLPAVPGGDVG